MTKEEMVSGIQAELDALEEHSKLLLATCNTLRKTIHQGDVNFAVLREVKQLVDDLPEINVKATVKKIQKALLTRGLAHLKELA
jgi:hypothetical protein